MKVLIVLAVLLGISSAIKFEDCGAKGQDVKITVSGCDDSMDACPLPAGTNVTLTAEFTAGKFYCQVNQVEC